MYIILQMTEDVSCLNLKEWKEVFDSHARRTRKTFLERLTRRRRYHLDFEIQLQRTGAILILCVSVVRCEVSAVLY